MPAIFPELLPDELLYSAIARYQEMMCLTSKAVLRDVFGRGIRATALIDLPTRIETFVERLPPGHTLSSLTVIRGHTTFPYFARFVSAERVEHATAVMLGRRAGYVPQTLGIAGSAVIAPTHLNYCEACRDADRKTFGAAYWHRVHQLPGVFVCPAHAKPLCRSPYERSGGTARNVFRPLDQCLPPSGIESTISPAEADLICLEQIAEDSHFLLTTWTEPCGTKAWQDRFRALASATGFGTDGGRVWISKLRGELTGHYGPSFLEAIGCTVAQNYREDWLTRLFRRSAGAAHPLQCIVVARLLGQSIQKVLHPDASTEVGPGDGIQSTGTVIPQISTGRHRGPEWDARLKALVVDSAKTLTTIAAELRVSIQTVQRHARRLGVWRDRWKLSERVLRWTFRPDHRQRLREERQGIWLALRAAHPTLGRMQLAAIRPEVHQWLIKNERVWLDAHSPPKRGRPPVWHAQNLNWTERDEQALRAARAAVRALLTDPSGARRVTLTTIGHKIGMSTQLRKYADRLPRTIAYIRRAIQLRSRWERRRLYRIVIDQLAEGAIPRPLRLASRASIGRTVRPELRALADRAVETLHHGIELGAPFSVNWSDPMSPGGERASLLLHPLAAI